MKFRVAILEKRRGKLEFKKFEFSGYYISNEGVLYKGKRPCNTTDRRKKIFYEINYKLGKKDRLERDLYEHDIVFDSRYGCLSKIIFNDAGGAFVLCHQINKMKISYRYCGFKNSVELIGNDYQNQLKQITAKGMTK